MRRMRLLLLGKCSHVLINKPSVEIEDSDDEERCKWEHAAQEVTEMEVSVVTKTVTNDFEVAEIAVELGGNENLSLMEQVEIDMNMDLLPDEDLLPDQTDNEVIDAKKKSCSYQVCTTLFATCLFINGGVKNSMQINLGRFGDIQ